MADAAPEPAPAAAAAPPPVPAEAAPAPPEPAVQDEAADVVPDALPPSPASLAGTGGDPALRDGAGPAAAAPEKKRRARRRSVVEIGRGALAKVGLSEGGGALGPAVSIDESEVDLDSILALTDEQLEDKLSDKVLTLLKRSTEDLDQPPPVDAIQLLAEGAARQSSEARAVIVDYLRRKVFAESIVVRRKALLTLQLLMQHAGPAMLPNLRENDVALLDIEAMTTFELPPGDTSATGEQVAAVRAAAAAVMAAAGEQDKKGAAARLSHGLRKSSQVAGLQADDRTSSGKIARLKSGVGGTAKGFRDNQKQTLLNAKDRLAKSRGEQGFGELSKEMLKELESAVVERDEPLEDATLARYREVATTEAAEADGAAGQAMAWLLAVAEQATAALVKHKAMQLIDAMLIASSGSSLVLVDMASDSRQLFDSLLEYTAEEDPRVPSSRREDDAAELAVAEVKELADQVVEVLKAAQERVLAERQQRREAAAAAREELKKRAAVEAPAAGMDENTMLLLLECTSGDEAPSPLEAVMYLTSVLQNAAVHAEIKKDMLDFRVDGKQGTLSTWAKTSAWASDTGGEKDENGAPKRAQEGIWLEMWESVVALESAEGPAAGEETVLLLKSPEAIVHYLNGMMKDGNVNMKVKSLHLMKDLYDGMDPSFVAAVKAHSTPFVSELLSFRCEPHPRYGDKPMKRVRNLARLVVEEIHPKLRDQRLEEIARRQAQAQAQADAVVTGSPRVLGKLGIGKKKASPTASEAVALPFDDTAAKLERVKRLAHVMFAALDQDKDGILLCHEVQELARQTGGSLSEDDYVTVCMQVGSTGRQGTSLVLATSTFSVRLPQTTIAPPSDTSAVSVYAGINEEQLLAVYVEMRMGNIEQDFVLMDLPDPPAGPDSEEAAAAGLAEEGVPPEPAAGAAPAPEPAA